jgi:hypothetical protein
LWGSSYLGSTVGAGVSARWGARSFWPDGVRSSIGGSVSGSAASACCYTSGPVKASGGPVHCALWTQPSVTFEGKWHHIDAAGINPLPVQRPIPVWFGGGADALLRRIVRMGDGWIREPQVQTRKENQAMLDRLFGFAEELGRDPASIGIEGRIEFVDNPTEPAVLAALRDWQDMGVNIVTLSTRAVGLDSPQEQMNALKKYMNVAIPFRCRVFSPPARSAHAGL